MGDHPGRVNVGAGGGRLSAHAEQVVRATIGQRHQLEALAAVDVFTGEAQGVPPQRLRIPERRLCTKFTFGSSRQELGSRPSKCAMARTCMHVGTCSIRRRA